MEGGAVMQVLREVGDIGNDQFAKTVLSQWPYPSKTLYLDIKSYLEMETKKLPIGHTEEAEIIKQRMIVVYKAATELLDKELRQDLQLWAEAVFPFLKKMDNLDPRGACSSHSSPVLPIGERSAQERENLKHMVFWNDTGVFSEVTAHTS